MNAVSRATPLKIIGFKGLTWLPFWAAENNGDFARENLAVELTATPGSVYQFQHLSAGDFDMALTAFDNIVAYDEGQGQAQLPNPADFVAFVGFDSGFLQLVARPEIHSYADLRGKTLAVDALTTGYAFVLRKMLADKGLHDGDYQLKPFGATGKRYAAMQEDPEIVAGLLTPPVDVVAREHGFTILGPATAVIGPYQASVAVARRPWLAQNGDVARRFIRAALSGLKWLSAPGNRSAVIALLAERTHLAPAAAAGLYPALVNRASGFQEQGRIEPAGVRAVLALRSEYGEPHKALTDPEKYIDLSFYRAATAG